MLTQPWARLADRIASERKLNGSGFSPLIECLSIADFADAANVGNAGCDWGDAALHPMTVESPFAQFLHRSE
ncbi:hypothetical protein L0664_07565 [Octadecabacter sp. G9-8]|uniref:Uncharacterized protein n=1 Tax=Octadecabacter dasysiphoniae TaxID=2909341 RepID=A0ABS9CUJ2_9RHOB|nr:hypothetical protein [Octadecabacter dasysiphoniae]MCF2870919.1 hypothetical protein [Octadecabacter dasysiphoniae]